MTTKKRAPKSAKSLSRAERNIEWIEAHCRIPEGRFVGKPFVMPPYMRDDLIAIYDNEHGTRRAIFSRGRKNLKTTEASLILLLHLCGYEAKPNAQLYSTAQSRDQAAVLWAIAAKIVRLSPTLSEHITIRESAKMLAFEELGTTYRALSADSSTSMGLSPALHIADELGQVRGPRSPLFEALETASGTQDSPLTVIISTQAPSDSDLLSTLIDDALQGADPRTVLRFASAPAGLDPFSEAAILAANPAYAAGLMNKTEVLAMAGDAKRMPARQAEYENLILNRRVEASSPFISREVWKSCGGPVKDFPKDVPVWGGLDLAATADMCAWVKIAKIDGVWHVRPTFWLPADGLAERARSDRAPYDLWVSQGHLIAAPGASVDYEFVAQTLRDDFDRYNIRKVCFDRWNMRYLKPWLVRAGFSEAMLEQRFEDFGMGTKSMSPALRELEADVLNGRLAHGNHPVLTMNAACAVVEGADASNRRLSKARSSGKIDGLVALVCARGGVPLEEAKPPPQFQMYFA